MVRTGSNKTLSTPKDDSVYPVSVIATGDLEVYEKKETVVSADNVNVTVEAAPAMSTDTSSYTSAGFIDFNNGAFWFFLLLGIVAGILLLYIGGTADAKATWNSYAKASWENNLTTLAIFQFLAVIFLFIALYLAYRAAVVKGDVLGRNAIGVITVLQILGWVIGLVLLFRQRQTLAAAIFSVVLVVVVLVQFYFTWRVGSWIGFWMLLPYTAWLVFATVVAWNIYTNNH